MMMMMMMTIMHLSKSLCNDTTCVHQFLPMACKDLPSPEVHQRRWASSGGNPTSQPQLQCGETFLRTAGVNHRKKSPHNPSPARPLSTGACLKAMDSWTYLWPSTPQKKPQNFDPSIHGFSNDLPWDEATAISMDRKLEDPIVIVWLISK